MSTIESFDYSVDLEQALIWQYENATNLQALITKKQNWYDVNVRDFWESWFYNIFYLYNDNMEPNPLAFTRFGVTIWSLILGIPLQVGPPPDPPGKPIWGFNGDVSGYENFDNGNFTTGYNPIFGSIEVSILILKLRYFQLTLRPSVTNINKYVCPLFIGQQGYQGTVYVLDNLDMTMTYVFTAHLPPSFQFILANYDILPRPAAVGITTIVTPTNVFGFDNNQNFDNGSFLRGA